MCGRHKNPHEFVHDTTVGMCFDCYQWHRANLESLVTTGLPKGCAECRSPYGELSARQGTADVRMVLEKKDGIYQVLCPECADAYERKRADMYGATPYGWRKKLQGSK